MKKPTNHNRYKILKKCFNYDYLGFNIATVFANDLIYSIYSENKFIHFFKLFGKSFFIKNLQNYFSENVEMNEDYTLYSILTPRKDYYELLGNAKKYNVLTLEKKTLDLSKVRFSLCFKPNSYIKAWKLVYSASQKNSFSIWEKVVCFFVITYAINQIKSISKLQLNHKLPKKYVAFNSSCSLETYLILLFKSKMVPTYSLQHGIYFRFHGNIPLDIINIENFCADYMLCWGEYSKHEMQESGVAKSKLLLAGNPNFIKYTHCKQDNDLKECLVFLARSAYEEGNIKLLKLLSSQEEDINYYIKLHPSLDATKYKNEFGQEGTTILDNNKTSSQLLGDKKFDFVLTYNTTVYYESINTGHATFAFKYAEDGATVLEEFTTQSELLTLINLYRDIDLNIIDKKLSEFGKYTLGNEEYFSTYNLQENN